MLEMRETLSNISNSKPMGYIEKQQATKITNSLIVILDDDDIALLFAFMHVREKLN